MSSVIIGKFGPSARQILDAAVAIATRPQTKLVVGSMPEGATVLGGADWSGRRKKDYERGLGYLHELSERCDLKNQVFLGGACGVPWRADAMRVLGDAGLCYYNPEVEDWDEQDAKLKAQGMKGVIMELEAIHKKTSYVLLFVFDPATRAIATLNECVEFMMAGHQKVVIVTAYVKPGQVVGGQALTVEEAMDINIARAELFGIAKARGVAIFSTIDEGILECVSLLRDAAQDLYVKEAQV